MDRLTQRLIGGGRALLLGALKGCTQGARVLKRGAPTRQIAQAITAATHVPAAVKLQHFLHFAEQSAHVDVGRLLRWFRKRRTRHLRGEPSEKQRPLFENNSGVCGGGRQWVGLGTWL